MSDVATTYNVADASIVSDGVTNALQATATSGDPIVVLRTGAAIDTQRFRNLTFALTLDTAFGFDGAVGDGSVARVIWHTPSGAVTVSKDIPVWPGRNLYTIDLSRLTTASGLEPSSQAAWSSSSVSILRIDPHESTKGVRFRLGTTVLTAPDEVVLGSAAVVQFAFADSDTAGSSYQARIYLDADRAGDGRVLLDTFAATPNVLQTYQFVPAGRGIPAGEYFFYVEVTETRGGFSDTRGLYSSGPLRVLASEPASPPPSSAPGAPFLRPLQTGQNPAAVAWSPGRAERGVLHGGGGHQPRRIQPRRVRCRRRDSDLWHRPRTHAHIRARDGSQRRWRSHLQRDQFPGGRRQPAGGTGDERAAGERADGDALVESAAERRPAGAVHVGRALPGQPDDYRHLRHLRAWCAGARCAAGRLHRDGRGAKRGGDRAGISWGSRERTLGTTATG